MSLKHGTVSPMKKQHFRPLLNPQPFILKASSPLETEPSKINIHGQNNDVNTLIVIDPDCPFWLLLIRSLELYEQSSH